MSDISHPSQKTRALQGNSREKISLRGKGRREDLLEDNTIMKDQLKVVSIDSIDQLEEVTTVLEVAETILQESNNPKDMSVEAVVEVTVEVHQENTTTSLFRNTNALKEDPNSSTMSKNRDLTSHALLVAAITLLLMRVPPRKALVEVVNTEAVAVSTEVVANSEAVLSIEAAGEKDQVVAASIEGVVESQEKAIMLNSEAVAEESIEVEEMNLEEDVENIEVV
jgi:hypothetical protein